MKSAKNLVLSFALMATLTCLSSAAWAADVKGRVTVQGMRSAANIAVYVDAIPGKNFPPPTQHALMDQSHLQFAPHLIVVLKGSTVDFTNEDAIGHNIYWPSIAHNKKSAHNMGTWPQGQKKSFTFDDVGDVPLLCNVHPEMSGYIVVVPTPYFAVTGADGSYSIRNVPDGKYTLKTWSEDGKPSSQDVTVAAGAVDTNLIVKK